MSAEENTPEQNPKEQTVMSMGEGMGKRTEGIPEDLNLSNPFDVAKVAVMPNPTHFDLIEAVADELRGVGMSQERLDVFLNSPFVVAAKGKSLAAQRVAFFNFWNTELLALGTVAYQARMVLGATMSTYSPSEILRVFKMQPMDTILSNNLPALPKV